MKKEETVEQRRGRFENQEFINNQVEQAQVERKDQDEYLDDMLHTIKRLGVHGREIDIELKEQNKMLDEVNEEMDTAMARLNRLSKGVDKLLKGSTTKKIAVIIILLIILVLLIYFMF